MTNEQKNAFLAPYFAAFAHKIETTAWNNVNLPSGTYSVQCRIQEGLPGFVTIINPITLNDRVIVTFDEGGNIYVDADFMQPGTMEAAKKLLDAIVDLPEVKLDGEPPVMTESEEDSLRDLVSSILK